jgi:large subunit ribosomal protein L18
VTKTIDRAKTVNKQKEIGRQKQRRKFSVRNRLRGDAQRPRMCVFRSSTHVACQLIDDMTGQTLVSASTRDKDVRDQIKYGGNCDAAKIIGRTVAEKALGAGIKSVRFDRGCYKYHGRVAALADAAREAGLSF